jgi:hypothetical protein
MGGSRFTGLSDEDDMGPESYDNWKYTVTII